MAGAYVVVDTETANLRGAPLLLELGALLVVDGVEQSSFHALVRPGVRIDPAASAIHGIVDGDLVDAEELAPALARFERWRAAVPFVAHNAGFDANVLAHAHARAGRRAIEQPWYDSLKLARCTAPDADNHRLATLVRHFALGAEPPHRALADARACAAVVRACLALAGLPIDTPPSAWPGRASRALRSRSLTSAAD
ncbi:MAG: 3'-5' exonuclease [Planctomycetota bacterium]|nr:MAG: 3'-5' exonuclease [Planctomycetota bacterium]